MSGSTLLMMVYSVVMSSSTAPTVMLMMSSWAVTIASLITLHPANVRTK